MYVSVKNLLPESWIWKCESLHYSNITWTLASNLRLLLNFLWKSMWLHWKTNETRIPSNIYFQQRVYEGNGIKQIIILRILGFVVILWITFSIHRKMFSKGALENQRRRFRPIDKMFFININQFINACQFDIFIEMGMNDL